MTNPGEDAGQTPYPTPRRGVGAVIGRLRGAVDRSSPRDSPGNPRCRGQRSSRAIPRPRRTPRRPSTTRPAIRSSRAIRTIRHPTTRRRRSMERPVAGKPATLCFPPPAPARRLRRVVVPAAAAIWNAAYGTPPPPGYGPPPTGYPAPEYSAYGQPAQKTNSMAIASIVASCIGVLWASVRSSALRSAWAMNQIKQTREGGHGLAIAGIVSVE